MTYQLAITSTAFRQLVEGLSTNTSRTAVCPAGINRLPNRLEFLVRLVRWSSAATDAKSPYVLVVGTEGVSRLNSAVHAVMNLCPERGLGAIIALGIGPAAGSLAGACLNNQTLEPLSHVSIIDARLPRIPILTSTDPPKATDGRNLWPTDPTHSDEIWSRTIGALGMAVWQRLSSLHFGVVGCGRTGSLMASMLRGIGVRRITLIDPDMIELHNLGEMDVVTRDDVGLSKAQAIANHLKGPRVTSEATQGMDTSSLEEKATHLSRDEGRIVAVPESVLSLSALVHAKEVDVLVCGVDNATARLATAFLAALYMKPLLDIGTGVFSLTHGESNTRHLFSVENSQRLRLLGADIRLVLPNNCLHCFGGITQVEDARNSLLGNPASRLIATNRDWRQERAGSLRSLNTLAVGLGLRLLEDFIGGYIRESTWLHLEFDEAGIPVLERRTPNSMPSCPLCSIGGRGDDGIDSLSTILNRM